MTALQQEVRGLVDGYFKWLKEETRIDFLEEDNNVIAITTPHLDRHNDFLQITVTQTDDGYELSDDGYILSDLKASGCLINTPKRKAILREVLNGFDIKTEHNFLIAYANAENFAYKKHSLIQGMLAVNDMFFTSSSHVKSFFFEDVRDWMKEKGIPFIEGAKFTGKSGFDHKFDFSVPAFHANPERYITAINHPTRQTTLNFITSWEDTKPARPRGAEAIVFLNTNRDEPINATISEALNEYEVKPILWKEREDFAENLSIRI